MILPFVIGEISQVSPILYLFSQLCSSHRSTLDLTDDSTAPFQCTRESMIFDRVLSQFYFQFRVLNHALTAAFLNTRCLIWGPSIMNWPSLLYFFKIPVFFFPWTLILPSDCPICSWPTFKLQLILRLSFCPAISHRTCTCTYSSKNGMSAQWLMLYASSIWLAHVFRN